MRKPGVATRGSHAHHTAGLLTLSEAGNHLYTGYPEPGLPHGGFADTLRTRTAGEHIQHRFLLHGQLDHGRAHLRAKMRRGATDVPDTGSLTIAPVAIRGYPRRHIIRK